MTLRHWRRAAAPASMILLAALVPALSSPASADTSSTLTVVGTSDVFDSGLIQDVIEPGFEKAYPQYDFQYVSKGTGAAIAFAEAGTASALLVHAAALENQFVADGYSAEGFGRAIFWGDYVLLGPASDPAGVLTGSDHDIVGAFQKIAAAGVAGKANFVSRGGTPGTTVQEHTIWALTNGVPTCTVSAANGGGTSPSTTAGNCPTNISLPSWYHATGLTQGPNILNGDTCNYTGGGCYVFTDRGTFNFLQSQGQATNLKIVTRDNTVPGQTDLLVNSFHAYAISAAKFASNPNVAINTPAAEAFLNWITSPQAQAQVGSYLNKTGDAPFLPSAAPSITTNTLPDSIRAGKTLKVKGTLANAVPGTPALSGITVRLMAKKVGGTPFKVDKATTDANGKFILQYKPNRNRTYYVETSRLSKVERPDLTPVFGDKLAAATLKVGKVKVQSKVQIKSVHKLSGGHVEFFGQLSPKVTDSPAKVTLYASRPGHPLSVVAHRKIAVGDRAYDLSFHLGSGTWKYELKYTHANVVLPDFTTQRTVTIP